MHYQKRISHPECPLDIFTDQEYSDLMAYFNLVWFSPSHKNKYPELRKLIKKGKNYDKNDRRAIIEIQRDIIRKIIPTYKKFVQKNRVEITTSPYYHPILPILLDINEIKNHLLKICQSN